MKLVFDLKPRALQAKKMTIYKLFQGLIILYYFPTIKLIEFSLILSILDKKIKIEDLQKYEVKREDIVDYTSFKLADLLLGNGFMSIKRNSLNLTDKGKKEVIKILENDFFKFIEEEVKKLLKYKKLLKSYYKHERKEG